MQHFSNQTPNKRGIVRTTVDRFSYIEIGAEKFSGADAGYRIVETSKQTITRAVGSYHLGSKLRSLRLRKKIALADLSRHTGLSASMLSQLETGRLIPTLPTLARIAMVFDVGLEFFFSSKRDKRPFAVLRQEERMRFPERSDSPQPAYFFECLSFMAQNKSFEVYIAEFPVCEAKHAVAHQHPGAEFVYVMEGSLAIGVGDEEYLLNEQDSAYFDSSEPHRYLTAGPLPARALVVTAPPR